MYRPIISSHLFAEAYEAVPTPLSLLNEHLCGGLPRGTLSEIYGIKSTFKTQFILTLAAHTVLRGSEVLLFDSDGSMNKPRIVQIITSLATSPEVVTAAFDRVHIVRLTDWHTLIASMHMLPLIASEIKLQFLAVDSLSSLFRTCNETAASKRLEGAASRLRQLAVSQGLAVVITNGARADDSHVVSSAMGDSWRHVVGTRLLLRRTGENDGEISIIKSGVCAGGLNSPFIINEAGITNPPTS